jgi:Tol biopolymer transport system component
MQFCPGIATDAAWRRLRSRLALAGASFFAIINFAFNANAQAALPYGNPQVAQIVEILSNGARPHLAPDGQTFVVDSRSQSGYYDLFTSDLNGNIQTSLTLGNSGIAQLDNGNGIYHPSGDYIAFISEAPVHYLSTIPPIGQIPIGDPGIGLFSNLWITNGIDFWQQTNVPMKQTANDGIPVYGTVNPRFSADGKSVVWTQRYANGEPFNWGVWRLMEADLVALEPAGVALTNERVIFTPEDGYYVTAMAFISPTELLVSGNLDGQNIYGMDLYNLNLTTGTYTNLTNTPTYWEEGSCIAPSGRIVYMTNQYSNYTLNFNEFWVGQPLERDYVVMNPDGSDKTRLTYFNDPSYADYVPWRAVPIVCDITSDGMTVLATVGHDYGTATQAYVVWQVWLIKLNSPL